MNTYKKLSFGLLSALFISLTVVLGQKALWAGLSPTVSAAAADQISLTAPTDGSTVKGRVVVSVKALASVGIGDVVTSVNDPNNTVVGGATSPSYAPGHNPKSWSGSGTWDTSSLPDGKYTITAALHKEDGTTQADKVTVTTDNGNKISLTAPTDGSTVKGKVVVSVKASASAGIEDVETRVDDPSKTVIGGATSPSWVKGAGPKSWSGSGTWDTSSLPDGKYTITAAMHRADGTSQTDTATVTTDNGNPPIGSTGQSCESSSFTSLEFVFCPLLRIMDSLANFFTHIIENLLAFNVKQYLNPQVKNTWSIFRTIASALLVIIMLIAVISQAIGGGPVDAYTLRKILPRLVAAVIIIQISWVMLGWFIELANDLGHGVRNLISAPFGGWGNLDLEHLVGQLGATGSVTQFGLFTGLGIAFVFSGLTIGGLMLIAGSAILTDLLAFVLLVLRQVFIVASVILFPIAIICWILPGTQKYWKLWSDNFIKLLMLFPLIMGIIYTGRIFAHIFIQAAGPSTSDKVIATLVMFVGFFGPFWLLPRAFRWGGQLYAAAANGAMNATQGARAFPRKYGLGAAKENRVRRGELRAERLAANPNNRSFRDRLLAGEFNLAKSRGRGGQLGAREMDFAKTLAAGEKESRESVPAQLLRAGYDSWRHGPALDATGQRILEGQEGYEINKLDGLQAWLEGRTYAGITPDAALRGHAFDTLATLGDPDRIRMARQNSEIPEEIWSKAVARNFSKLNEIARYLTLTPDLSGLAVRQFSTQDDDTALELVRQLEGRYVYDRETGGRTELTEAQHRAALQRAANLARDARNPLIWVDLGEAKKQVITEIERLADAEGIRGVEGGGGRQSAPPATSDTPPPPTGEPPEAEIQVDHDPGT